MKHDEEPSRLSEHPGLDPWVRQLLRSAEPYKASPGRKQRLLLGLGRAAPRRVRFLLRPAIVAGILIGFGAVASAAFGPWGGWVARTYDRLVPRQAPAATAPVIERARTRGPVALPTVARVEPPVTRAPSRPPSRSPSRAPSRLAPSRPTRASVAWPHARPEAPAVSAPQGRQPEQDTQLVLEGMRALRLGHDPVRARDLLADYLDRHPRGALAEEALALTIEAAVAHHDDDAPALAARYLRHYPAGPFRALADEAQR